MEHATDYVTKYLKPVKLQIAGSVTAAAAELTNDMRAMSMLCEELYNKDFDLWYNLQLCIDRATKLRAQKQKAERFNAREYESLLR